MANQSKWSSSRVAQARTTQQAAPSGSASVNGTQQSRWATTNDATGSSNSSGTSTSSSWRSRPNPSCTSASSTSRSSAPSSNTVDSSGSRWARPSSSSTVHDDPVSTLTNTLSRTSLASQPPPSPSTSLRSPPPSATPSSSMTTSTALPPRSRPLGGKPLDRLALLASPSRGLDSSASLSSTLSSQGSMDLTLHSVQVEFRDYISTRIAKTLPLLSARPALRVLDSNRYLSTAGNEEKVGEGEEELQQVLLLVRKLREALVSSRRVDHFAVESYELSAYLAVLCGDATQLAASLPRLVLELYPATTAGRDSGDDVDALASKLGMSGMGEGKRLRMVAMYLLQTLCLSGRATRLGQSTSDEALHRGFAEYRLLRTTLAGVYGDALSPHLATCDAVYAALRDIDPLALASLLTGPALDGWQRLIVLSVLPAVRSAAWAVAKKAYMYRPVSAQFVGMMQNNAAEGGEMGRGERWLIQLLMLGTDVLPATIAAVANQPTPDQWDADADDSSTNDHVEQTRLLHFLTTHLAPLTDRIMPLKSGSAIKLR